jgi:hypothetical protein
MPQFNFEKFTSVGRRFAPQISIRANGAIGISQGAIHQAAMTEPGDWYVFLHFDRSQKVLGIQPIRSGDEDGAIKVSIKTTPNKEGGGVAISAFVSAKSFLNFYSIPYAETTSFDAQWDPNHKMLIAFLAEEPAKNEPAAQG